ncbi:MAG: low-complexity tail membrane protein [Cyanobacteria bacterium J06643_13]
MKTRSELFLWIHLGGIIMFPLFLTITLVGLCTGERYSYVIELPLLVLIAIVPILLMQLYRPFNIFSVLFLSLKPETLTENQKKILVRFQTKQQKLLSAIAAILMLISLGFLYILAPTFSNIDILFLPRNRALGLAIAIIAFLGSNLFLQIPLSALQVLSTKESELAQTQACTSEEIARNFTTLGFWVKRIPGLTKTTLEQNQAN